MLCTKCVQGFETELLLVTTRESKSLLSDEVHDHLLCFEISPRMPSVALIAKDNE